MGGITGLSVSASDSLTVTEEQFIAMKQPSSEDLIGELIARRHQLVLEKIFLSLSLQDLRHCRLTCKTWLDFLRQEIYSGFSLIDGYHEVATLYNRSSLCIEE